MSNDCKILLVTDKTDSISDIIKNINTKFSDFETADTESSMISLFESMSPEIIIFYHSDIESSVKLYLHIQTHSKNITHTKHRAILICDGNMISKAIEKCTNNVFYDYLVFNPEFDRLRINLLISKALESIGSEKNNEKYRTYPA